MFNHAICLLLGAGLLEALPVIRTFDNTLAFSFDYFDDLILRLASMGAANSSTDQHLEVGIPIPLKLRPWQLVGIQQIRIECNILMSPIWVVLQVLQLLLQICEVAEVQPLLRNWREFLFRFLLLNCIG